MNSLYAVMYHYTRDLAHSRYPGIKGLDYALFEEQLRFFKEHFHPVTMEEVLSAVERGTRLPENALLLTFDDGYIDNFTVAFPLLTKYDLQGSFFIPGKTFTENKVLDVNKIHFLLASVPGEELKRELLRLMDEFRNDTGGGYQSNEELYATYSIADRFDTADTIFVKRMLQTVLPETIRSKIAAMLFDQYIGISEECFARELYLNRDQIRCMKKHGMFFGLHGYDHYWLANLPENEMRRDIDRSLEVMEEFIDLKHWVMNYPYGNCGEAVITHIKEKGCALGLTTEVRIVDIDRDDRYTLPRLDCNDFPPKSERYKYI